MTAPWLFTGAPKALGPGDVTALEGTTFCISDRAGNMAGGHAQGLFVSDTRLISSWELTIAARPLTPLTVYAETPHEAVLISTAASNGSSTADDLLVVRRRYVGNGMREAISVCNTAGSTTEVQIVLRVAADFADVFDVKNGQVEATSERLGEPRGGCLDLKAQLDGREYGLTLTPEVAALVLPGSLTWHARVPGHGVWLTNVEAVPRVQGRTLHLRHPLGMPVERTEPVLRRQAWRSNVPSLETADSTTALVLRQSVEDLATLRIFDPDRPETPVVAAGAPWFMALFGRDSLLTSIMLLPLDDSLALGTLATLGAHQGKRVHLESEEEPGRVLHELRFGPSGTLALGGRNAYFGTADATPLFVVLMGELLRWSGPEVLTPENLARADRALSWMVNLGDADGDGFIEYQRKTAKGLVNQGWKDSWDGVNFADGTIAEAPIALAEVQGYTYAAFRARADMAAALGDRAAADDWYARAARLKRTFNETFWLPERGWYAIGLDRRKTPIDALASNNGHLLWTGIVEADKAEEVAQRLLSPELFSGWGIRTLATSMGAYNPMSYHNGSVWPHDTAICIAGLARYGYLEEAGQIAMGMLDAAAHFGHRLPELFAGFARTDIGFPVPYPAACSPQAWAAAAPVELLRALLRLEPRNGALRCDPVLPERLLPLRLLDIRWQDGRHTVEVDRDGWRLLATDDVKR